MNGGGGQFALNFNRWFGAVADLGAVHNGNISGYQVDTTITNFLLGPRFTIRKSSRVTPYFQILWGGVYAASSTAVPIPEGTPTNPIVIPPPVAVTPHGGTGTIPLRATKDQTAFAMAVGGGLDIKISRVVSFRLIGLDYYLTRLQNYRSADDNNQHNLRYTTGLNFTFGGEKPAPVTAAAPTHACWDGSNVPLGQPCPMKHITMSLAAAQTQLCPGATVAITPSAGLPDNATYQWTINGQPIGNAASLEFGTTGREPGVYKVGLTVAAPLHDEATAESAITIRAYAPPSGTLQLSEPEVLVGGRVTLTANFAPGQCGGTLHPAVFAASEGSISGNQFDSSGVQFDPGTNTAQQKTVTITATVADDKSSAKAQATLLVKKPAATLARRLPDIVFPSGNARVNNCGKRVLLEELKASIESDSTGTVVLVGHVSPSEAGKVDLDQRRVMNAAAVISAGEGVCYNFPAAKIMVGVSGATDNGIDYQAHFCGTSITPQSQEMHGSAVNESDPDAKYRRVEVWFVPTGGQLPASLSAYKDAASLSVANLGCPK